MRPNNETEQYADYEEIIDEQQEGNNSVTLPARQSREQGNNYGELATTLMDSVSTAQSAMQTTMDMAQTVGGMYKDCLQLHNQRKMVESYNEVKLANTIAKFKLSQQFLTDNFGERREALQHDYKVLDDAIAKGDREMILAAMAKIGDIVTTSPLADLEKMLERFDDPDDSMLDF